MASPPSEYRNISKSELNDKYASDDWPTRLLECRAELLQDDHWAPVSGRTTLQKRGRKYFDADGNVIAVVFEYRKVSGTTTLSIRMLRDAQEIVYYV